MIEEIAECPLCNAAIRGVLVELVSVSKGPENARVENHPLFSIWIHPQVVADPAVKTTVLFIASIAQPKGGYIVAPLTLNLSLKVCKLLCFCAHELNGKTQSQQFQLGRGPCPRLSSKSTDTQKRGQGPLPNLRLR